MNGDRLVHAGATKMHALRPILAAVVLAFSAGVLPAADDARQGSPAISESSPLRGVPTEPGEHIEKIESLGANDWLDLGVPRPDPKHGGALGRSYSPKMAFAPDLRGAFLYGEGVHAFVKEDGRFQDGLWFYDAHAHAWINCSLGTPAKGAKLKLNVDDFWEDGNGEIRPVTCCHGWHQIAYDPVSRRFAAMTVGSNFSLRKAEGLDFGGKTVYQIIRGPSASPWFWDVTTGRWERHAMKGPIPNYAEHLLWIPSIEKFWFRKKDHLVYLYDPAANEWETVDPQGPAPPFGISAHATYDPRRDRVYLAGGISPEPENTESLWIYDVRNRKWINARAKDSRFPSYSAHGRNIVHFDTHNDVLLLFHFDSRTIHAYSPEANAWSAEPLQIPESVTTRKDRFNGYYDPELNAHFIHCASDSRPDGVMRVYRYRPAAAESAGGEDAVENDGVPAEEPAGLGPNEALKNSAAVFVGEVTSSEREGAVRAVTFEVSKSWKGPRAKTVKLLTPTSGAFNGYRFRKGESYLVYCLPRGADADDSAPLWTNNKSRTRPISEADEDLMELGEPRADDDAGGSSR